MYSRLRRAEADRRSGWETVRVFYWRTYPSIPPAASALKPSIHRVFLSAMFPLFHGQGQIDWSAPMPEVSRLIRLLQTTQSKIARLRELRTTRFQETPL